MRRSVRRRVQIFLLCMRQSEGTTFFELDPVQYSLAEFEWMAHRVGMAVRYIGGWQHPRDQKMLGFKAAHITRGTVVHLQ